MKEEPGLESSLGSGFEAPVLAAGDVWMDHSYNRAMAEPERESREFNKIFIKGEPIAATGSKCPDGELLISGRYSCNC